MRLCFSATEIIQADKQIRKPAPFVACCGACVPKLQLQLDGGAGAGPWGMRSQVATTAQPWKGVQEMRDLKADLALCEAATPGPSGPPRPGR